MPEGVNLGGSSGSREPNPQAVSALTGFDPGRKEDAHKIQWHLIRRQRATNDGIEAAKAVQWLREYGRRSLCGTDYADEYSGADEAKPFLKIAREEFATKIVERAVELAVADIEAAFVPQEIEKESA